MPLLSRLVPCSITAQITTIVAVSVLLGLALIVVSLLTFGGIGARHPSAHDRLLHFVVAPSVVTLTIVLVFVTLLSVYAVRWIIAPLSSVAAAAQSFGRSPDASLIVGRGGPREIAQVADALNDMRTRIRALLDDRTRMLAAISHDLRTPLTRLRLRAERVSDQELREGMLREITHVARLLDETLDYLREDVRSETRCRIDLPSVLQTICAQFADVGHAISYEGPSHLTWTCRASAVTRAVSNVVDNAVKHGSAVTVALRARDDGAIEIDVADDGPGIPSSQREKVFDALGPTGRLRSRPVHRARRRQGPRRGDRASRPGTVRPDRAYVSAGRTSSGLTAGRPSLHAGPRPATSLNIT